MIATSDIEHMSVAERFQAMEVIWSSLQKSPEEISSPAWHGEVLSRRLAKMEAGQAKFLTVEQLKVRLAMTQS
jgi:putative addiction module component (TIGR02574 family)